MPQTSRNSRINVEIVCKLLCMKFLEEERDNRRVLESWIVKSYACPIRSNLNQPIWSCHRQVALLPKVEIFNYIKYDTNSHFLWSILRKLKSVSHTCNVPPPPVLSQSSETLTIVQGSYAFQWKSTTLSLHIITKFIRYKGKQEWGWEGLK